MRKYLGVALLIASFCLIMMSSSAIYGLLVSSLTLPSVGSVKTVGVGAYWDSDCTNEISMINWGSVEPGDTKTVITYIKNDGSSAITLSLDVGNWSPSSASSYISISWNYAGQQLNPGDAVEVRFTLSVSSSISGISSFICDITITGSG